MSPGLYRAKAASWAERASQPGWNPAECLQLRDSYLRLADTIAGREAMPLRAEPHATASPEALLKPDASR